ncbi:hypothetical protein AUP68_17763 [Ilyonectria robusta]
MPNLHIMRPALPDTAGLRHPDLDNPCNISTRINCVFETPHSCLYLNFAKLHDHCQAVSKPSFPPKPNPIDSHPLLGKCHSNCTSPFYRICSMPLKMLRYDYIPPDLTDKAWIESLTLSLKIPIQIRSEDPIHAIEYQKPKSAHPTVFVDVTEHQIEGPSGWAVEIIPTKHFRRNETNNPKKISTCKDYKIVLRRTWMQQRHISGLVRIDLEILSENLCEALRNIIINSYEDTDLKSYPIKLRAPFKELFFYRKEIKDLSEDEDNDPDLRKDAKALHDFV